jgi:hypothetical protein
MIDLAKIGEKILQSEELSSVISEAEHEEDSQEMDNPEITTKNGIAKEIDNFSTSASGSVGMGLIGALIFDSIKNRGEDGVPMFLEPWRTMMLAVGAGMLGFSVGKVNRGLSSQKQAEYYKTVIRNAEEEKEAETVKETKEAEEAQSRRAETLATLGLGEFGSAVGQSTNRDYPKATGWW